MRALENRLPPPILVLLLGAAMALTLAASPPMLPPVTRAILAGLFFAAAGVFAFPAFAAFGRANTTIDPVRLDRASSLVTDGIYRFTRNPMYVALTLLLCAWAAWLARPLADLGPVVFVLFIDRFQIVPEERMLAVAFAAAYADYCRAVRRWF